MGPRPGRPQVSWVVLFMEIFPIQPHCTADSADRTNEVASVVTSRHESLEQDGVNGVRVDFVFTHLAATAIYVKF